jgi:MFS transporter, DHA3 family, macrolide efflux protein
MEDELHPKVKPYPKWKRRFFIIWSGQALSMLGSNVVNFAIVWYLTEKTGSATTLAIATLFSVLPGVFLSPFAGAWVDRIHRKSIMIFSDLFIGLGRLAGMLLFAFGLIQLWHIYLIIFLGSAAASFQQPAMAAATSLMVPKKHLSRVAGANQTLGGVIGIVGPPLGALLMNLTTIANIFLLDVLTMLIAVLPLIFTPLPEPALAPKNSNDERTSFFTEISNGFTYVLTWPGLGLVLLMALVVNLMLSPAMSLLPLLVTRHFGGDEIQLAMINSTTGIGMVIGGLALSIWGGFKNRILTTFTGLIISGAAISAVAFIPTGQFLLAVGFFGLMALMMPLINGPLHATVQAAVQPEMQGRVFSLMNATSLLGTPIGLLVAGPASDWIGIQSWFFMAGVAMAICGLLGLILPATRNIEQQKQPLEMPIRAFSKTAQDS